jgi:tetratricopeptide (TPR) repeat protein
MRMYKHDAAREIYERVLARVRISNPRSLRLCSILNDLALAAQLQKDHARAEELYHEAIDLRSELVGEDNPSVAIVLINLAYVYVGTNRLTDALEVCERARTILERSHGEHNPAYAHALHALAGIHYMRGESAEAEALCKRTIEIRSAALAADHPDLAESYNLLGKVLSASKRYEEAAQAFTTAAGALERGLGHTNMRAISAHANVGSCQIALKQYDEARKTLEPAFEAMRACPDAKATDKRAVAALLVRLHNASGRPEEAARYEAMSKDFVDPPPARAP